MALSIVVPENCEGILNAYTQNDCKALLTKLETPRSILFYQENVTGFIIYTASLETLNPATVYLEVQTKQTSTEDGVTRLPDVTADNISSNPLKIHTAILQNPITCQNDLADTVWVWKFDVTIGCPKWELGACTEFRVSLASPYAEKEVSHEKSAENCRMMPGKLENLFEGLNFHTVLQKQNKFQFSPRMAAHLINTSPEPENDNTRPSSPTHQETSLSIPTFLPLVLKLRSTKPGGRNDILLTTLSMEVSGELAEYARKSDRKYRVNIVSLDAVFKAGSIDELGHLLFPRYCAIDDMLNVTYRLISSDYLDAKGTQVTAKLLQLTINVQVQKYDVVSGTYLATNTIATLWAPVLDFGHMAPPISNWMKSMTSSPFQVQSQFTTLSVLLKNNSRKSGTIKSKVSLTPSISNSFAPPVSLAPTRATSLAPPVSSAPTRATSPLGRRIQSTSSSPVLSGKSVVFSKKPQKSMVTLPSASAVTVNLGTNSNLSLSGLLLTFKGNLSIDLGNIVTWKVQAINQTGRPLNLSLIVKSRRRNALYLQGNSSSGVTLGQFSSGALLHLDSTNPGLVLYNRQQLYSQYNLVKLDKGGVVLLTNDVRLGPLEHNEVFEAELQLIGIAKGIFNLDGLRVIDLSTGDGIDFGKLVEVFVI